MTVECAIGLVFYL